MFLLARKFSVDVFNLPKVSVVWTPFHQVFPSVKMKHGSYFDDSRNNLQFTTDISKVTGRTHFIIVTPEAFSNQSGWYKCALWYAEYDCMVSL